MSDLMLSRGDLTLIDNDLATEASLADAVGNSISRRIRSTSEQYQTIILEDGELKIYDSDYGADFSKYVASPINTAIENLRREVPIILAKEPRITLNKFSVTQYNEYSVAVDLDYTFNENIYTLGVVT